MRSRAQLVDAAVAAVAFVASALVLANGNPVANDLRDPDVFAYVLLAAYSASVVIRRSAPVVAVFGGMAAGVIYAAANYPNALTPAVLLPIYTAAAVLPQRPARLLLAGSVVLGMLGATFGPGPTNAGVPAVIVSAWLLGNYVGSRRAYTAELEQKNVLLAQARLDLIDRAIADERLRIARELHDVVAHTMSVVALHAGTGRMVADDDPGAARQALATIESATRSALVEMRRMLGVLRGSTESARSELAPAPGLDDLDTLVAEVERSGVCVDLRVDGERPAVPAGVDLSAYRIVQEALTNVIKHAGRARATVSVRYSDDAVCVEVDDDGRAAQAAARSPASPGHGLVGMRERVSLYDGQFEAGFRPDGGFRVSARLPFGRRP
ncbi:MAG TPA: sensor histidine kinase [Ilumatobacteraceae bacterium]|nr:sensor histidine kinase [Ilumatobacteraceae bacterium]